MAEVEAAVPVETPAPEEAGQECGAADADNTEHGDTNVPVQVQVQVQG